MNKPLDFFSEIQRITQAYCEINGLPPLKDYVAPREQPVKSPVGDQTPTKQDIDPRGIADRDVPAGVTPIRNSRWWKEYGKTHGEGW